MYCLEGRGTVPLLFIPRQAALAQKLVPGEAFQLVHLTSIDVRYAWVVPEKGGARVAAFGVPTSGFIFPAPVEGMAFGLEANRPALKPGAPTMEAPDADQKNVGLWAGFPAPLTEWRCEVFATKMLNISKNTELYPL